MKLKAALPDAGFRQDGYYVWCGSVIRSPEDGLYHMFASRWSDSLPFHPGWLTSSEVVRAVSRTLLGPYSFAEVVFPARGGEYWDGCMTHNPRIVPYRGKYLLFYTGSSYPFPFPDANSGLHGNSPEAVVARSRKRVGIAVADSLTGPWTRFDAPALDTRPGTYYSFLTSNPSPVVEEDGSLYLMFKARAYEGQLHGKMSIGVARAAAFGQPFEVVTPTPVFSSSVFGEVEDPFVWKDSEGIYHMLAKDMTGAICGTSCDGVIADSPDGIHWQNPRAAYTRNIEFSDGTTQNFALRERPALYFENNIPKAFFTAVSPLQPYGATRKITTWNLAQQVL